MSNILERKKLEQTLFTPFDPRPDLEGKERDLIVSDF